MYVDRSMRWPNIRIFQTELLYLEVSRSAVDPDPYPDPDWIRISMGYLDPDPYSQSGSGSRRVKMAQEHKKKLLDFIV